MMGKHTKVRAKKMTCPCGADFVTGSSIKRHCSVECRLRDIAAAFCGPGCWEWPGSSNPQTGYGQLSEWASGKRILRTAHRVSYSAFKGPVTDRLQVLHRCDNRRCFNPQHLFLGTQQDNMDDMDAKGRRRTLPAIGERHGAAKATVEIVATIRASDASVPLLAREFGLSESAIWAIRKYKTWRHLP
jgi:hypothetical protein